MNNQKHSESTDVYTMIPKICILTCISHNGNTSTHIHTHTLTAHPHTRPHTHTHTHTHTHIHTHTRHQGDTVQNVNTGQSTHIYHVH